MRHIELESARRALELWGGDPSTLEHLATSGNSVYACRDGSVRRILRLTDPEHRTAAENDAEMEFLLHLDRCGVPVSAPIRSRAGRLVEIVDGNSASLLAWADGLAVEPNGPHWNEPFFRCWGRSLGRIHAAARGYAGPRRWEWRDERLLARAGTLLPAADHEVHRDLELTCVRLDDLPRTSASYGMTHADFAQQNFRYDPAGTITAFDFGNCCHHWFASDLVISLSTLRRQPDRDLYRDWILDGYREASPIDERIWAEARTFLRLRIHYVYLSRLMKFGPDPTPEEQATLRGLRARVQERIDWP